MDRIEGEVSRGEAGGAVVPQDVDVKAALPEEPWDVEGEDRVEMRVRVDALEARRVADEVGQDKVVEWLADGSVELVLGVSSFASIRSWVLGLLDHATIVEPAAFREELVTWLGALDRSATAHGRMSGPAPIDGAGGEAPAEAAECPRARDEPPAPSPVGAGRLARPGRGGARSAEAASRFGMSEKELVAELELAACCGTPPYTPDTLMEIEVSEHSVRAFLPAEYARPRRLTPAEGFAVAASARLLLAVPGSDDDALRRALAKLDAALGSREAVGLDVDAPAHLAHGAGGGRDRPSARDRLPLGVAGRARPRAPWNRCRSSRSTAIGISTPTATGPETCGASGSTASVRRDRSSARRRR